MSLELFGSQLHMLLSDMFEDPSSTVISVKLQRLLSGVRSFMTPSQVRDRLLFSLSCTVSWHEQRGWEAAELSGRLDEVLEQLNDLVALTKGAPLTSKQVQAMSEVDNVPNEEVRR
jgi:hypothetical protein